MSVEIIEAFRSLSTPTISDALDVLLLTGGCLGLRPVVMGHKIVGPAYTVRYIPIGTEKTGAGDFLDDVPAGSVVVLDNGGRTYCTVWGDLMTRLAKRNGVAGTVIDGVCRDVDLIRELQYPIFTRGAFMMTGKGRMQLAAVQETVTIGERSVQPGDLVIADDSGVVVVPQSRIEEVLHTAQGIADREDQMKRMIEEGLTLKEARSRVGYHQIGKQ
ncbi:MAG: RraA family protein [Desulfomonilaceae bacterium]